MANENENVGRKTKKMDKIMAFSQDANSIEPQAQRKKIPLIRAHMGKPTYPINPEIAKKNIEYWQNIYDHSLEDRKLLTGPLSFNPSLTFQSVCDYGSPQGDLNNREQAADALNHWYHSHTIKAEHIVFTVGGAAGLHLAFKALKEIAPGVILTVKPYYTLYEKKSKKNSWAFIDLMKEPGYRLTAVSLSQAFKKAANEKKEISAFLWCDPHNPTGTASTEIELKRIARVLRRYPKVWIILDSPYEEMRFDKKHISLFSVAPDLHERMVVFRSLTKSASLSGERIGVAIIPNTEFRTAAVAKGCNIYGHAPRSGQQLFATAIECLNEKESDNLITYYASKVNYVADRLNKMGAAMQDAEYKVEGTFYILADLSDLLNFSFSSKEKEELMAILQTQTVFSEEMINFLKKYKIETDVDIAYYLLTTFYFTFSPLSYFGGESNKGYMRITCSENLEKLTDMMNRIEQALLNARKWFSEQLQANISEQLKQLKEINLDKYNFFQEKFVEIVPPTEITALTQKKYNMAKQQLLKELNETMKFAQKKIMQKEGMLTKREKLPSPSSTAYPGFSLMRREASFPTSLFTSPVKEETDCFSQISSLTKPSITPIKDFAPVDFNKIFTACGYLAKQQFTDQERRVMANLFFSPTQRGPSFLENSQNNSSKNSSHRRRRRRHK